MPEQSRQKPLMVQLLDISPHNKAILEFYIASKGHKTFKITQNPESADAFIIDYDFPNAKQDWDENYAILLKPRIILAMQDPQESNAIWVAKPLTSQSLTHAADEIQSIIQNGLTSPQTINNESVSTDLDSRDNDSSTDTPEEEETFTPPSLDIHVTTTNSTQESSATVDSPAPFIARKAATPPRQLLVTASDVVVADEEEEEQTSAPQKIEADQVEEEQSQAHSSAIEAQDESGNYPNEAKQKRWELLCGNQEDTPLSDSKLHEDLTFLPENHLISSFVAAMRLAKQTNQIVRIKFEPYQFLFFEDQYQIYSDIAITDEAFSTLCSTPVKPGQVNLHILNSAETEEAREQIGDDSEKLYNLESLIWSASLLTARGRLPKEHHLQSLIGLKYWPSFTRLETFPYAMRIAAYLYETPNSLPEIAKKLAIPQRYVFAFYNGALSLGLIETDTEKLRKKSGTKPPKNRGLLSRLFKRLLKGGNS